MHKKEKTSCSLLKVLARGRVWLWTVLFLLVGMATAEAWTGYVLYVLDGDSMLVQKEGARVEIRLYGIDAPEYNQPYGSAAGRFARTEVQGKKVTVIPVDTDRYGRTVAWVRCGGRLLNQELVQHGYAWVYTRYCLDKKECGQLKKLERAAKRAGRGLWKKKNPLPPWRWKTRS
ncbi:MAG: hypothetical protein CSA33_03395 [Desulfobulbus propionicus]|nr:MAG: hypothetical protein CSA33_03395 [Desulfobulbus propionicus]